jgi:DNA polymerase I-like protein with 3'-5' exonuclease and polymerase domains
MKQKVTEQLREDETKALEHFQYVVQQALNFPEGNSYRPNPGSWQQLKKLFYDPGYLGLKHRTQGTDADARKQLMADPRTSAEAKEVLVAINKWKEISKFRSTYAEMRLDKDNRFRTVWNQQGVQSAPGRLSSSQTLWGTGMNVQNQPPAARKFFIADPGCVFFYFDLSQAEARVVAYRADIDKWKEDFERARIDGSYDAHRALASEMFKVPYDDVPKSDRNDDDTDYTIRYIAKRCRHGLNYRMHIDRLAETTGLSYARAAASYHAYHKINPEIQKWWAQQELLIKRERQMFNALGRRWKVLQRIDDDALIPIVAFYPQSTIGDKVCQVWYQSQEDDRWDTSKARIVFNIHDALIGMATKEYAKTALSICKAYAEKPMMIQNVYGTKTEQLIVPADTAISSLEQRDKKGTVISIDKYHRWSGLVKEKIEAASLAA